LITRRITQMAVLIWLSIWNTIELSKAAITGQS
jgi:hypothetical protein